MSLPPGFLDELRSRLSIARVVGRKVMWDNRKSNQAKGDMWAPCPFHQEKTASFHVDDQKGYYYCFGCHAKGDAISFVRETENVGFMEAIEILAGEAGMPMPERDPRAQEKADWRTQLVEVMELAVQFFRLQLKTQAGAAARDYLAGRGLSEEAQARWEIGLAPPGWSNLWDHLTGKGVEKDQIVAVGLARESDRGRDPYDTFRNRIIFPIRDARGRCIAFGGRALDPGDNAKYLNSPETELFDKSRSLFNLKRAREAAGKGQALIVAEGYMDVIALSEAGFEAAVAPLGTAVTQEQLAMIWRIAPEPVITLDGDTAGQRAAGRVMDLALPLLEAGASLRFAMMPEGMDPDDLLRAQGPGGMRKQLDAALPMVQLLWQREIEGRSFDSPERRAALDKALRDKIRMIRDPSIRGHYGEAIRELRGHLFGTARSQGPARGQGARRRGWRPGGRWALPEWKIAPPMPASKASLLATGGPVEDQLREAVILATLIRNPGLLPDFLHELERMVCATPDHARLRDALLRAEGPEMADEIAALIGTEPLEKLFAQAHVAITPAVRRPDNGEVATMCLAEELAKLNARRGHTHEVEEAIEDLSSDVADERLTTRLAQSSAAMNRAGKQDDDDRAEYDTGPNGARMKREERSAFDELLSKIDFAKGRGPR
ncbi:DNA primase [Salibaculum sp.]|uniref:DNA primase n=1 Tax=Salibaculum sp. TaxID=2855480 RepID=UPI002B46716C|nr:DNA primase [Salibaculum sp.]HKL68800.1 DNA primase [Salibaculum sp.]